VFAAGVVWIAVLAALVFTSSNPVVVNRAQVLSSSVIAIGHRDPQKPDEFVVTTVWQGAVPAERITVRDWPEICPDGEIVVPLLRIPNQGFRVTQGELPNPPLRVGKPVEAAMVRPLVYPATEEVLGQITSLVGPPAAR
jgi:hypothetical protein